MAFINYSFAFFMLFSSLMAVASAFGYGNAPNPKIETPESAEPKVEQLLKPPTIAVQGIIYCKSGSKLVPLKGNSMHLLQTFFFWGN